MSHLESTLVKFASISTRRSIRRKLQRSSNGVINLKNMKALKICAHSLVSILAEVVSGISSTQLTAQNRTCWLLGRDSVELGFAT
jgi:hypothetical protein